MSDLALLDTAAAANGGFDVVLRHPGTGKDLDIVIQVYGRDSDKFKAINSRQTKVRIERMRRAGRTVAIDAEELEDESIELLSQCTYGWRNVELDGKPLEFSTANAAMVYRRFPWIREQVDAGVGDRANFTKPLPEPSSSSPVTTSNSA